MHSQFKPSPLSRVQKESYISTYRFSRQYKTDNTKVNRWNSWVPFVVFPVEDRQHALRHYCLFASQNKRPHWGNCSLSNCLMVNRTSLFLNSLNKCDSVNRLTDSLPWLFCHWSLCSCISSKCNIAWDGQHKQMGLEHLQQLGKCHSLGNQSKENIHKTACSS